MSAAVEPVPPLQHGGEIVWIRGPGERPGSLPLPRPDLGYGKSDAIRGVWSQVAVCACGNWFLREAAEAPTGDGTLYADRCPRCRFVDGVPVLSETAKAAMCELRWRLDNYRRVKGTDNAKEREAFLKLHDASWLAVPVILAELERVYGNQVQAQVQEILVG